MSLDREGQAYWSNGTRRLIWFSLLKLSKGGGLDGQEFIEIFTDEDGPDSTRSDDSTETLELKRCWNSVRAFDLDGDENTLPTEKAIRRSSLSEHPTRRFVDVGPREYGCQ
jgi:hypothetical protein